MDNSNVSNMSGLFSSLMNNEIDIAVQMTMILGTCVAGIFGLILLQQPKASKTQQQQVEATLTTISSFLPNPDIEPSKYVYEMFVAIYTPIWIFIFGCVVVTQYYESLTPIGYIILCAFLALPLLLQPIVLPGGIHSEKVPTPPDSNRPLWERYSCKANVWIAVYSFIGNYWYTHYFYSVLQASYTMPNAIRLNNVPIQMYFATHFYFSTYHFFSNCLLRKICTTYQRTWLRDILFISVIIVFSYFTAFMETLTISSYPYYTFKNRHMAYTIGSAFYGIYFIVSFPAFYFFDQHIDHQLLQKKNNIITEKTHSTPNQIDKQALSVGETIVQSCGYGMIILFLLDFVRVLTGIPLIVGDNTDA